MPVRGLIRLAAFAVLVFGGLAGVFMASGSFSVYAVYDEHARLLRDVNVYLDRVNSDENSLKFMVERVLRYAAPIVTIWFLAFIPLGALFTYALLFLRACAIGFTAAILYIARGAEGLTYAALLMAPQNLLWLPALLLAVCGSAGQAAGQIRAGLIMRGARAKAAGFRLKISGSRDYVSCLLFGLLMSFAAAFIETWITPMLLRIAGQNT